MNFRANEKQRIFNDAHHHRKALEGITEWELQQHPMPIPLIPRKEVEEAIEIFLASGGKIEKLPPADDTKYQEHNPAEPKGSEGFTGHSGHTRVPLLHTMNDWFTENVHT